MASMITWLALREVGVMTDFAGLTWVVLEPAGGAVFVSALAVLDPQAARVSAAAPITRRERSGTHRCVHPR
jgi:hypothetical protein